MNYTKFILVGLLITLVYFEDISKVINKISIKRLHSLNK